MRGLRIVILIVLASVMLGNRIAVARPAHDKQADSERVAARSAPADDPSGPLVLYWDETKESLTRTLIPGARTVILSLAERRMLRRSDAGLTQVGKADSGGGTTVNLEGRYQSLFVSLVDLSGRLRIICLEAEPGVQPQSAEQRGGSRAD